MSFVRLLRSSIAALVLYSVAMPLAANAGSLTNGSFETGDLTGWTRAGFFSDSYSYLGAPNYAGFLASQAGTSSQADTNGVLTQQTSSFDGLGTSVTAVNPTNGSYLSFVSNQTSAGTGSLTGSSIFQTFDVPVAALTLTLDVRLLNNDDAITSPNYGFNDFGGVALTQGATVLGQYNIALDSTSGADAFVTSGLNAGGFLNSTGWLSVTFNISSLSGQTVTLTNYVVNQGDDSGESRLLIDNIQVNALSSAVPEPSTVASAGLGLLFAAGALIRRGKDRLSA